MKTNQELTPLELLKNLEELFTSSYIDLSHQFKIIETGIIELKELKNICGELIESNNNFERLIYFYRKKAKAFEIIKNKKVIIEFLMFTNSLEEYNKCVDHKLTQEEYDLLKELF